MSSAAFLPSLPHGLNEHGWRSATSVAGKTTVSDHVGNHTVETSSGPLSAGFASAFSQSPVLRQQLLTSTLAIAGNERVAVIASKPPNTTVILQYTSLDELQRGSAPEQTSAISHLGDEYSGSRITQKLVAYETGFALLAADGCVYTWGDERYAACLGREVTGST